MAKDLAHSGVKVIFYDSPSRGSFSCYLDWILRFTATGNAG